MNIIHILNFYDGNLEAKIVQERTLASIYNAAKVARNTNLILRFIIVGSSNDLDFFKSCQNSSSLEDICESVSLVVQCRPRHYDFLHGRTNPCLTDTFFANDVKSIIREKTSNDSDKVIISNSDICLNPSFYIAIKILSLNWPLANFAINRETIDQDLLNMPISHSYGSSGKSHIGHDCFILTHRSYQKVVLIPGSHIIGFGFVMRPLLANLILSQMNLLK